MKNVLQKLRDLFSVILPSKKKKELHELHELDKKLVYSINAKRKFPHWRQLKYFFRILSKPEKQIVRYSFYILIISAIALGGTFASERVESAPRNGGEYTEALVGAPRYVNPILAQTNDVDMDISRLIFSGLMKYDDNKLMPDLAAGYEMSEDQKVYTFTFRDNIKWHDGEPFTVDDVIFTLRSIQDQQYDSPLYRSLQTVEFEKIEENKIQFTLENPFTPFPTLLTFGILPEHLWGSIPSQNAKLAELNIKPVGTGSWQFHSFKRDREGNIKSYTLERFDDYYDKKPYIETLTFKFFTTFQEALLALNSKTVEGISYLPKSLTEDIENSKAEIKLLQLPQVTAVFFNQSKNEALKEDAVRKALSYSVDKKRVLNEALKQEGKIIHGPILPGFLGYTDEIEKYELDITKANELLEEAGYEKIDVEKFKEIETARLKAEYEAAQEEQTTQENTDETSPETTTGDQGVQEITVEIETGQQTFFRANGDDVLKITLTTVNSPENVSAAQIVKESWEKIGVNVTLSIVSAERIQKEIIQTRNYEALVYGEILGYDPDPFPFWHSTQINDPGLNLALFSDKKADQLIIEARQTNDDVKRAEYYKEFQSIVADAAPAVFLYSPTYPYILPEKIQGFTSQPLIVGSDRFDNISDWFIKTKWVLKK